MKCGYYLGKGIPLEQIIAKSHNIEGIASTPALLKLAEIKNIDMPIVQAVNQIILQKKSVNHSIDELLSRPFREEGPKGQLLNP